MQRHRPTFHLTLALLGTLLTAAPTVAAGAEDHSTHVSPSTLVAAVRQATRLFVDINVATASGGYEQFLGCVSGPMEGAMGVHFVNFALVQNPEVKASEPEALIYEFSKGRARLVGVEFIVDAAAWHATNPLPPVLEGQTFQFVDSPNRFHLDPFYELHVWAWRDNPNGSFVDWNTRVTCDEQ